MPSALGKKQGGVTTGRGMDFYHSRGNVQNDLMLGQPIHT
jgi:hypothetical protein